MAGERVPRSERLLAAVSGYQEIVVITHDNPDPDAIAGGWALLLLIQQKLEIRARLIGGGEVVRAENRHMLKLLQPPLELVQNLQPTTETAAIFVDCELESANHLPITAPLVPVVVIDHHATSKCRQRLPFVDVRPKVAASATIAAGYLREQKLEPSEKLATALQYAIRTETRGSATAHSRLDRAIIQWLTTRANPTWLAEIENAPLSRAYFSDMVLAMQNTFLYDGAAFCLLPRAEGPEVVGEVADLLIRCDGISRVLCGAAFGHDVLLSTRTQRNGEDAALLLQTTIAGIGRGGGHHHRAGGKISGISAGRITDALEDDLRDRWLAACHIDRERGTRLVARQEIVQNL